MFLHLLLGLSFISSTSALNYFWLSWDPVESAKWYCDQHCFKIGSEVIESIWDVVMVVCPDLEGTESMRKRRHARDGCLWHPLSVWHGLCRANMHRGLINANAIFEEHYRRTGTRHTAWKDCLFLLKNISKIDFSSDAWVGWFFSQNGKEGTKYTPIKTKPADLAKRRAWCLIHAPNILNIDREQCSLTEPPQCINEVEFRGCRVPGDVVKAYRRYYQAKLYTMGLMRYYHTSTLPPWVLGAVIKNENKIKIVPYQLDDEGYVVVEFCT
jgi:hypothetical protein